MARKRDKKIADDETVLAHVVITANKREVRKAGHKPIKGRKAELEDGQRKQPRWRQIEAMRERQELRRALADIWGDDPDLDESIFGIDDGEISYYVRPGTEEVEDEEIDLDEDGDDFESEEDEDDET